MSMGEKIKELRLEKELTQQQLAEELDLEGKSIISMYENGTRYPSLDILIKLTKFFNVSADYFLEDYDIEDEKTTNKEEIKGTAYLVESDILDQELAKKMVQILANDGRAISAKRAYKIIDIAKSLVDGMAYIYYKD